MKEVIIAGGEGTRLFPVSTPSYPKHLVEGLIEGGSGSLLQHTYARAAELSDDIYIVPDASHAHHVAEQLPQVDADHMIVEPARRGTASCVLAALARIKNANADSSEPVVFMHGDQYIPDTEAFADSVRLAAEVSQAAQRIVLLGITPTYPATGFGYIERTHQTAGADGAFDVTAFHEKPNEPTAREWLETGRYVWNMGIFVASTGIFESTIKQYAPELWHGYQQLVAATPETFNDVYRGLKSEAIDIALIERIAAGSPQPELAVVPTTYKWHDLGSFRDLWHIREKDEYDNVVIGNVTVGPGVVGCYLRNDTDRPLGVADTTNRAIVHTVHGSIDAPLGDAKAVGDLAKRINART